MFPDLKTKNYREYYIGLTIALKRCKDFYFGKARGVTEEEQREEKKPGDPHTGLGGRELSFI